MGCGASTSHFAEQSYAKFKGDGEETEGYRRVISIRGGFSLVFDLKMFNQMWSEVYDGLGRSSGYQVGQPPSAGCEDKETLPLRSFYRAISNSFSDVNESRKDRKDKGVDVSRMCTWAGPPLDLRELGIPNAMRRDVF